jgi:plastocyanin
MRRRIFLGLTVLGSTVSSATELVAAATHTVIIRKFDYEPKVLTVSAGDVIQWVNEDIVPHTATALDQSWDTGEIKPGAWVTTTVTEGIYSEYFCVYHPMMKGSVLLSEK